MPEIHEATPAVGIGRQLLHHAEVGAGAEGAAGARERHRARAGVGLDRATRAVEIAEQLGADRVELARAIEDHVGHRTVALEANRAHGFSGSVIATRVSILSMAFTAHLALLERGLRPRSPALGGSSEERASSERRAPEGGHSPSGLSKFRDDPVRGGSAV